MENLDIKNGVVMGLYNKNVETITIPEGIKRIESSAFKECKKLKEVIFPESLTEIGWDVFWGCKSLEKIVIPAGVRSYGGRIFWACSNLRELTIQNLIGYIPNSFDGGHASKCTLYIPSSNYKDVNSFHEFDKYKEIKPIEINIKKHIEYSEDILKFKKKIEDYYSVYLEVFRRVLSRVIDETNTDGRSMLYNRWETKQQARIHLENDLSSIIGFTLVSKNEHSYGKLVNTFYSLNEILTHFDNVKEDISNYYNKYNSVSLALCLGSIERNQTIERILNINTKNFTIRSLPLKKNVDHVRWAFIGRRFRFYKLQEYGGEFNPPHFVNDINWKDISNLFNENEFVWFTSKEPEVDDGYVDIIIRKNGSTTWIHRKRGPEDEGQDKIRYINEEDI